ncbi:AzlD domain-containing protein [Specibacter sp. NPDC057265]|uniref:AzlD domain-containing protein n=1 Tax=Specibacter sp. NPDC057265 TaxID=3346075 RepID=UPI00363CB0A3
MTSVSLVLGIMVLAAATYTFRISGVMLGSRATLSAQTTTTLNLGTTVLLLAVAATATLYDGPQLDGFARPLGVLAGAACAFCKQPVIVTVLVAAVVTAGLRILGFN